MALSYFDVHQHKLPGNCSSYCVSSHHLPAIFIRDLSSLRCCGLCQPCPDLVSKVKPFSLKVQDVKSVRMLDVVRHYPQLSSSPSPGSVMSGLTKTKSFDLHLPCTIVADSTGPALACRLSHSACYSRSKVRLMTILIRPFSIQSPFRLRASSKWAPNLLNQLLLVS